MPSATSQITRQQQNEKYARHKAQNQQVYISGIQGLHNLETGVAYHYRGHYIYGPAGNPIEPIPYSTRRGIAIVGTRPELTPRYDLDAHDLVLESSISHLNKSCQRVWSAQQHEVEIIKKEAVKVPESVAGEKEDSSRSLATEPSFDEQSVSRYFRDPVAASSSAIEPSISRHSTPLARQQPSMPSIPAYATHTPHSRAMFLADSAPGSRFATPHASRSASPALLLRQVASSSRINQLLAAEGRVSSTLGGVHEGNDSLSTHWSIDRALSPDVDSNISIENWIDPREIETFVKTVSRPSSRPLSPLVLSAGDEEKLGVSGQKCPLHGGECDGETVMELWLTQRFREGRGFKDLYPVIEGAGGRIMVDWCRLLREEQEKLG